MKKKLLLTISLVVFVLAACSQATVPIVMATAVPTATATLTPVLPTITPKPTLALSDGKVYQVMEAFDDIVYVGQYYSILKGEKAFLDKDGQLLEIQDANGRVVMEVVGKDRFRFYAWADGYDHRVGNANLTLHSGLSYTLNLLSLDWNAEYVEVRRISTDQLVGYALLLINFDENFRSTGYEKPIAFIDSNGDELVSSDELITAVAALRGKVNLLGNNLATERDRINVEIANVEAAIKSGAIVDAYLRIKQLHVWFEDNNKN